MVEVADHIATRLAYNQAALGTAAAVKDIQEEIGGNLAVAAYVLVAPCMVIASFRGCLAIIVKLIAVGNPLATAFAIKDTACAATLVAACATAWAAALVTAYAAALVATCDAALAAAWAATWAAALVAT